MSLQKAGYDVHWVSDSQKNSALPDGSIVYAVNLAQKFLPRSDRLYYILHNFSEQSEFLHSKNVIKLQVFTDQCTTDAERLAPACYYNAQRREIYQPWGFPNIQPRPQNHFPSMYSKDEYFVGSIWNNSQNQGNLDQIDQLKAALQEKGIRFVHCKGLPDKLMPTYIRNSRYAFAVVGSWQSSKGYLPCRLFKNINFGRVGLINSEIANRELALCLPKCEISQILNFYDTLTLNNKIELFNTQMQNINHLSYVRNFERIMNFFE